MIRGQLVLKIEVSSMTDLDSNHHLQSDHFLQNNFSPDGYERQFFHNAIYRHFRDISHAQVGLVEHETMRCKHEAISLVYDHTYGSQ